MNTHKALITGTTEADNALAIKAASQDVKLYYYLISFMMPLTTGGFTINGVRVGFHKNWINEAALADVKQQASVDANATPIAVSYLGYMTDKEFNGMGPAQ